MAKLHLSKQAISQKKQLNCFTTIYMKNKANITDNTSFYVYGNTLEFVAQMPMLSPAIIAGTINSSMNKKDLNKRLYQKTITLLFCFDMALFLREK